MDRWRAKFHVPSDICLYVPAKNERADQPPEDMVAVNEAIIEAGLRFPLPFAVSYLLTAWNVAPLKLTPNAWLQIVCILTLFGGHRLYRLPSPLEMNHIFKLTAQKGSVGGYHIQGRSGRVILGVPNKVRGDISKWFWVGGAWKSATSDNPTDELDIPTGFRERNPSKGVDSPFVRIYSELI